MKNIGNEVSDNLKIVPKHRCLHVHELLLEVFFLFTQFVVSVAYSQFKAVVGGVSRLWFFLVAFLKV